jgi:haloacetate dehalogenase
MFEGFTLTHVDAGDSIVRARHGGAGPPLLLLHGHPRTHTTWHRVAPLLARDHAVVCPDLRGYGESTAPVEEPAHATFSKRAMARDCAALMRALGHERFAVAGHDRGAYVAFRLALDAPELVERLVVMDAVPIADALERCDARFAASWWHWFFLGQDNKPAERVICADPDSWYRANPATMGADNHADWKRAIHDPAVVHAMCEDYRAGLGIDREHDEADRAACRRVRCPTLFLWSERDDMQELYADPVAIWRAWAEDLRASSIPSGHHMAEEAPEELAGALGGFLAG